jgi:hypothetical protein
MWDQTCKAAAAGLFAAALQLPVASPVSGVKNSDILWQLLTWVAAATSYRAHAPDLLQQHQQLQKPSCRTQAGMDCPKSAAQ